MIETINSVGMWRSRVMNESTELDAGNHVCDEVRSTIMLRNDDTADIEDSLV